MRKWLNWLSCKGIKMVHEMLMDSMLVEMMSLCQQQFENDKEAAFFHLEKLGFQVGFVLATKYEEVSKEKAKQRPRQIPRHP